MNASVLAWGMWILNHQKEAPEILRLATIAYDKSGQYTGQQQLDAMIALLQIVKTIEADAPVHLFGAVENEGETAVSAADYARVEAEAESYGCGVLTLILVASALKNLLGRGQ